MKRWAIFAGVVVLAVVAAWLAGMRAEHRASSAEKLAVEAQDQARTEVAKGASVAAVEREATKTIERVRVIERAASKPLQEIAAHAGSSVPVDPDLARRWVAGLGKLCDAAGAGACDRADASAAAGGAGGKPMHPGPPAE